jgi:hypothetical protein
MPGDNPHGTRRIEPCYPAYRWPARFVHTRGSRANLSPGRRSEKRLGSIALSHQSHPRASPAGAGSPTSFAAASSCLFIRVLRQMEEHRDRKPCANAPTYAPRTPREQTPLETLRSPQKSNAPQDATRNTPQPSLLLSSTPRRQRPTPSITRNASARSSRAAGSSARSHSPRSAPARSYALSKPGSS